MPETGCFDVPEIVNKVSVDMERKIGKKENETDFFWGAFKKTGYGKPNI